LRFAAIVVFAGIRGDVPDSRNAKADHGADARPNAPLRNALAPL
jgi:hypothetical protein